MHQLLCTCPNQRTLQLWCSFFINVVGCSLLCLTYVSTKFSMPRFLCCPSAGVLCMLHTYQYNKGASSKQPRRIPSIQQAVLLFSVAFVFVAPGVSRYLTVNDRPTATAPRKWHARRMPRWTSEAGSSTGEGRRRACLLWWGPSWEP